MDQATQISKFLSFVLRHKPESIGISLDAEGWASINELIGKADIEITSELLKHVVTNSDKQRFAISSDGLSIRANQGHSISINLGLEPIQPPVRLFHGTATRFLEKIMVEGLLPQNRQYVHLSNDEETAFKVGQRHGKPTVLSIPALKMHNQGQQFLQAKNGVWLTKFVEAHFLI